MVAAAFAAKSHMQNRARYVWHYDVDEATFSAILSGESSVGRLDRDWAAVRLLEYAPYGEIVRRLGYASLLRNWPRWRQRVRAPSRRRGLDFASQWLSENRPDLVA